MLLRTPNHIESIAWEGELVPSETAMSPKGGQTRPVVTLGKPELWPAAVAMESEVGQQWTPPLGGAEFWLARFACSLRDPDGRLQITAATQSLHLRPRHAGATPGDVYAYSLFPDRLTVEDTGTINVKLSPELSFAKVISFKPGELGVEIAHRQVFPVVQAYGAGESTPSWEFKNHPAHPLDGVQFVYAVIAAMPGAGGGRGTMELVVTVQQEFGPIRYGMPQEEKRNLGFTI